MNERKELPHSNGGEGTYRRMSKEDAAKSPNHASVYYRQLAVELGAKPEDMIGRFDREYCEGFRKVETGEDISQWRVLFHDHDHFREWHRAFKEGRTLFIPERRR